jgi:hypothetical protein
LRKGEGIFRGSERPRLLLLAGVAVAGWLAVLYFWVLSPRRAEPARPRPVAESPTLPPPDDSPELQGIRDRTVVNSTDNAAFRLLFDRVRSAPPAELARRARHDVVFSQLLENPGRYRGLPIRVEGYARRVLVQDGINTRVVPAGRFFEAYVFTADSQKYPYVLAVEDLPKTLPTGDDLLERVGFDGYFLKMMAYRGGDDKLYVAPLLIGRLGHAAEPSPVGGGGRSRTLTWTLTPLIALFGYLMLRWAFHLKKVLAPRRTLPRGMHPVDDIDPDALAAWVDSPADDEGGDPFARPKPAPPPPELPGER